MNQGTEVLTTGPDTPTHTRADSQPLGPNDAIDSKHEYGISMAEQVKNWPHQASKSNLIDYNSARRSTSMLSASSDGSESNPGAFTMNTHSQSGMRKQQGTDTNVFSLHTAPTQVTLAGSVTSGTDTTFDMLSPRSNSSAGTNDGATAKWYGGEQTGSVMMTPKHKKSKVIATAATPSSVKSNAARVVLALKSASEIKCGDLRKRSRFGLRWNKRWVEIRGRMLYTYREKTSRRTPKPYALAGAQIRMLMSGKYRFEVATAVGERLVFCASGMDECRAWHKFIVDQIESHRSTSNALPTSPTVVSVPSSREVAANMTPRELGKPHKKENLKIKSSDSDKKQHSQHSVPPVPEFNDENSNPQVQPEYQVMLAPAQPLTILKSESGEIGGVSELYDNVDTVNTPSDDEPEASDISHETQDFDVEQTTTRTGGGDDIITETSAVLPPVDPSETNWDLLFQNVISHPETSWAESVDKASHANMLRSLFLHEAVHGAKTIIDEYCLPESCKTIKTQGFSDSNNVESGTFIHKGIVYEYAHNASSDLADEIAMKEARLDLHGNAAYLNSGTSKLRTPLCCVVDYLGFRLQATCVLPISHDSKLVFGYQNDQLVVTDEANEQLERAAKAINIKSHPIVMDGKHKDDAQIIHSTVDLTVYETKNHDFYVLNSPRVFPADLFDGPEDRSWHVKTLRREFVQQYHLPLPSDAFYNDGSNPQHQEDNDAEVVVAKQHLENHTIPQFVQSLERMEILPLCSTDLTKQMHDHGINCRYMGLIATFATLPHVCDLIVSEMIARACKYLFRMNMRRVVRGTASAEQSMSLSDDKAQQLASSLHSDLHEGIVDFFNLIFGTEPDSVRVWQKVEDLVRSKFHYDKPLQKKHLHAPLLFTSMQHHCGVVFCDSVDYLFWDESTPNPLEVQHLLSVFPRAKMPHYDSLHCHTFIKKASYFLEHGQLGKAQNAYELKLDVWCNIEVDDLVQQVFGVQATPTDPSMQFARAFDEHRLRALNRLIEVHVNRGALEHADCLAQEAVSVDYQMHALVGRAYLNLSFVNLRRWADRFGIVGPGAHDSDALIEDEQLTSQEKEMLHSLLYETESPLSLVRSVVACRSFYEGIRFYRLMLNTVTYHLGEEHPILVDAWLGYAQIFEDISEWDVAFEFVQHALEVAEIALGSHHGRTAECYRKLAALHGMVDRIDDAIAMQTKCISISQEAFGERSVEVLQDVSTLCEHLIIKGDVETALAQVRRLVPVVEFLAAKGEWVEELQEVRYAIAQVAEQSNDFQLAITMCEHILVELRAHSEAMAARKAHRDQYQSRRSAAAGTDIGKTGVRASRTDSADSATSADSDQIAQLQQQQELSVSEIVGGDTDDECEEVLGEIQTLTTIILRLIIQSLDTTDRNAIVAVYTQEQRALEHPSNRALFRHVIQQSLSTSPSVYLQALVSKSLKCMQHRQHIGISFDGMDEQVRELATVVHIIAEEFGIECLL
jgi:tetratricopeptide (TPR) repeat protein